MDLIGGPTPARTPVSRTPEAHPPGRGNPHSETVVPWARESPAPGTRDAEPRTSRAGAPGPGAPEPWTPQARTPELRTAEARTPDPRRTRAAAPGAFAPGVTPGAASLVPGARGPAGSGSRAAAAGPAGGAVFARPALTELRLSAFAGRRAVAHTLGPVTLFTGPSGSGKTTTLRAYEALARLGAGDPLEEVFPDAADLVPERARPDAEGRRGFRIGCTVDGPAGPVRLDLAVQAEPRLRIVGERLTRHGRTLLATALRDPGRSAVQAEWLTAGATPVTRAPLPDDLLGTALLPLRVAGKTEGQREVLAAAEQVVLGLRSVFPCEPRPEGMRTPVPPGDGRLLRHCGNLAEVLHRTHNECPRRHRRLAAVAAAGCAGPVTGVGVEELPGGLVRAVLERGGGRPVTPLGRLGDGELRYLALALTLLTGPGVLAMDRIAEVPDAMQSLTLLADDLDRGLDGRQARELAGLAAAIAGDGHIRVAAAAGTGTAEEARGVAGVTVVDLTP
ncbi:ATP-binding protein [Streptomyces sp.]|uniref:ATP-binding protein n=1 Tax=Streptomyces sp. TaxID=1931 RepID=UPI002810C1C8|nr:ATP-binding protein [Streptomyces sp.]